ncbi:MAG TPA: lasso peptide biosynthesis B2 protein [Pyrinomonadaceae bacterium]|nr:lasso peptide biosynthesis B2 protein [Pyrinomonadaceae bacterium]
MPNVSNFPLLKSCTKLVVRGTRRLYRDPGRATLLLRMTLWVGALSLMAKVLPLPRALNLVRPLRKLSPRTNQRPSTRELAAVLDSLLSRKFLFLQPVCWKRAAILHRFLALGGTDTKIVFGLRSDAGGLLSGHAWLEAAGEPILEPEVPNYTVTYSFPSNEAFELELASLESGNRRPQ